MKNICLYFQIHHPFSFQTFRFIEVGKSKSYYDDFRIEREIQDAVTKSYLPVNDFLLKLIHQSKGKLKLSFYISGTALDQFLMYAPMVLSSFRQLADTGQIEFLGGTASHSIASLAKRGDEFIHQIKLNKERMEYYFGQKPLVFVNTDLLFTNQVGKLVAESGYPMIITNGAKKILQWRSPNYIYSSENQKKINILFRNEVISNELTFLLSNPKALKKPEGMEQLFSTLQTIRPEEPLANIYLNYLTLGGFGRVEKLLFFQTFVSKITKNGTFSFSLPTELSKEFGPVTQIGTDEPICWSEHFHSSYFPGNTLQVDALTQLFKLKKQTGTLGNANLQIDWQYLQTSDHFHLMDENHPAYLDNGSNGGIYKSKYDAYINYMNILEDFSQRLKAEEARKKFKPKIDRPIQNSKRTLANHQHHPIYE
ncbi:MAG: hypothetical protein Q8N05_14100 [Bacteroidota bacterium]|nr:hypothetical protein [Bacteroidota bacterium]